MTAREFNFDGLAGPTAQLFGALARQRGLAAPTPASPRTRARRRCRGSPRCERWRTGASRRACCRRSRAPTSRSSRAWGSPAPRRRPSGAPRARRPALLSAAWSASSMWTANAATVSPRADTADRPRALHAGQPRLEAPPLRRARGDRPPAGGDLPRGRRASRPRAPARQRRSSATRARPTTRGWRRRRARPAWSSSSTAASGFDAAAPRRRAFPRGRRARQARPWRACTGSIRGARCSRSRHPRAIDAGVFHNDVIAVGEGPVLLLPRARVRRHAGGAAALACARPARAYPR